MKGKYINIDSDKLYGELRARKLTSYKVSVEMGYNPYFLKNSINRGSLCLPAVSILDRMWGIKRETYEVVPEPEPEPEPEPAPQFAPDEERAFINPHQTDRRLWQMTSDDLFRIIYAALRHANRDSALLDSRND